MNIQTEHREWHDQWSRFVDDTEFLFFDWISPRTLEDFRDKRVMDAGCGPGHHIEIVAPVAKSVLGVDLNTSDIAEHRLKQFPHVEIAQGDIAQYRPNPPVDVLYCIGVIHHTDNPDATFENLKQCLAPDGLLIIWCYSKEGNGLVLYVVEPLRRLLLRSLPRWMVLWISALLTALLYPFVYSIYLLPLPFLPYYEYFKNYRKLSFKRNLLNVFDKLNAPQTDFISKERIQRWFSPDEFHDVSIQGYNGVSWCGSGRYNGNA